LGFRPRRVPPQPAKALHPEAYAESDEPAKSPPAVEGKELRKPVVFLCPQIPALGLFFSSGLRAFQHGRLTLTNAVDVAAIRRHPWFGVRIFRETPAVQKQLAAQADLLQELQQKQRELADEAASRRKRAGPPGPFGPDPATEFARFPARKRRSW
jgi:hypothetical protein